MQKRTKKAKVVAGSQSEAKLSDWAWHQALGQITTGFAHDVNNALAGVLSMSELSLLKPGAQPLLTEELTLVKQGAQKASQLLATLTRLHFDQPGTANYHDLNALTDEAVDILRRMIKRRAELKLELAPGPLPVFLDGVELRKAIIFLALNATERIQEKGMLIFKTSSITEPSVDSPAAPPKPPCVRLTILDNGPGLDLPQLRQILEPDSAAAQAADDLSLRLSLTKRILENAKGSISFSPTDSGQNATHLFLPKANLD